MRTAQDLSPPRAPVVPDSGRATLVPSPSTPPVARLSLFGRRLATALAALALLAVTLVVVGPRFLPYRLMPVFDTSMAPALPYGSAIVVLPVRAADLRSGDVVTFNAAGRRGGLVTHRIVRLVRVDGRPAFLTKGDAEGRMDRWFVPAVGTGWRQALVIPRVGYALTAVRGQVGRTVVLGLDLAFATWLLIGIWRPRRRYGLAPAPAPRLAASAVGPGPATAWD
jgi:signal peptidase I